MTLARALLCDEAAADRPAASAGTADASSVAGARRARAVPSRLRVLGRDLKASTSVDATREFLKTAQLSPFEARGQVFVVGERREPDRRGRQRPAQDAGGAPDLGAPAFPAARARPASTCCPPCAAARCRSWAPRRRRCGGRREVGPLARARRGGRAPARLGRIPAGSGGGPGERRRVGRPTRRPSVGAVGGGGGAPAAGGVPAAARRALLALAEELLGGPPCGCAASRRSASWKGWWRSTWGGPVGRQGAAGATSTARPC